MSNIKEQMMQAQQHIKAKEYDKARRTLKGVNHPKAQEWLVKLDNMTPAPIPKKSNALLTIVFTVINPLVALIVAGMLMSFLSSYWLEGNEGACALALEFGGRAENCYELSSQQLTMLWGVGFAVFASVLLIMHRLSKRIKG